MVCVLWYGYVYRQFIHAIWVVFLWFLYQVLAWCQQCWNRRIHPASAPASLFFTAHLMAARITVSGHLLCAHVLIVMVRLLLMSLLLRQISIIAHSWPKAHLI